MGRQGYTLLNASRAKGDRFERSCVDQLNTLGFKAQRVPLSGAAGGMFGSDIHVETPGRRLTVECKTRKRAWTDLFGWLPGNDMLLIKADRTDTLVVMSMETFASLAKGTPA